MPKEFDKTNRAGVWLKDKPMAEVDGELDGSRVFGIVIPTGRDGNAPTYELFIREDTREGGSGVSYAPLFKPKAQVAEQIPKLKASGSIGWKGRLFWVSLWKNDKSDNPNAPAMSLTFKHRDEPGGAPKSATETTEPKPGGVFTDDAASGDDMPF